MEIFIGFGINGHSVYWTTQYKNAYNEVLSGFILKRDGFHDIFLEVGKCKLAFEV